MFVSVGAPLPPVPLVTSTSSASMFARPPAVVGLNAMVVLPAFTGTEIVLTTQVVQAPVPSNDVVAARAVDEDVGGPGRRGAVGEAHAERRGAGRRRGHREPGRRAHGVGPVAEAGSGESGVVGVD